MTWPPSRLCFLYKRAKSLGDSLNIRQRHQCWKMDEDGCTSLATKLVLRFSGALSDSVPPTICLTCPSCKSIHGRKTLRRVACINLHSRAEGQMRTWMIPSPCCELHKIRRTFRDAWLAIAVTWCWWLADMSHDTINDTCKSPLTSHD